MTIATTVKLPPKLKKRIAPLAKAAGKSSHAWMVDALGTQVDQEERRTTFIADAVESQRAVAAGEPVYPSQEVFAYLRGKVAGRKLKRPVGRKRVR